MPRSNRWTARAIAALWAATLSAACGTSGGSLENPGLTDSSASRFPVVSTATRTLGAVDQGGRASTGHASTMDRLSARLRERLPMARVDRVGEGVRVILEADSMFRIDSDELLNDANTQIESLSSALAETDGLDVLVVAHTDATGPAAYNLTLSERRAAAVGRALAGRSGSISNLETLGRGEDEPLATDETIEGRRRNSRIEIALYRSPDSQSADGA